MIGALTLTGAAVWQWRNAEYQRQVSLVKQLASQAELIRNQKYDFLPQSILLSIEALRRMPFAEADQALRSGLDLLHKPMLNLSHEEAVTDVTFSPDSKYLATASNDGIARIWQVSNGQEIKKFDHKSYINTDNKRVENVVFSPNGEYLVTTSGDTTIIWKVSNGQKVFTLENNIYGKVTFSSSGKYLTSNGKLWNLKNGQEVNLSQLITDEIDDIFFIANTSYLVILENTNITILDVINFEKVGQVKLEKYERSSFLFTSDVKYLIENTGSLIKIWDVVTNKKLFEIENQSTLTTEVINLSSDEKLFAISSSNFTENNGREGLDLTRIFDLKTGTEITRIKSLASNNNIFTPDNKYIIIDGFQSKIVDVVTGKEISRLKQGNQFSSTALSSDGKHIATANNDNFVQIWEVSQLTRGQALAYIEEDIEYKEYTDYYKSCNKNIIINQQKIDSNYLCVKINYKQKYDYETKDNIIKIWDIKTQEEVLHQEYKYSYQLLRFSPNNKYVIISDSHVHESFVAILWDINRKKEIIELKMDSIILDSILPYHKLIFSDGIVFSPNSEYVAIGGESNQIKLWNINSKKMTILRHNDWVLNHTFSANSKYLGTASNDNIARVWDIETKQELVRIQHNAPVASIYFSADNKYITTTSRDGVTKVSYVNSENVIEEACNRLTSNLSLEDWQQYLPSEPYRKTCPNLPIHPSFVESGKELARNGEINQAIKVFQEANKLEADLNLEPVKLANYTAQLAEVESLILSGDNLNKAIDKFKKLQNSKPESEDNTEIEQIQQSLTQALITSANNLIEEKDQNKALSVLTKLIEINPEYIDAYLKRGTIYGDLAKYQKAIKDFTQIIELDSNNVQANFEAYGKRGIAYAQLQQHEKAQTDLNRAIEIAPDKNVPIVYFARGKVSGILEDYDQAIADFTKVIELEPQNIAAYHDRGLAYAHLQKYQEAISDLNKAIDFQPDNVNLYFTRGIAYTKLEQWEKAIADLTKIIELNPDNPQIIAEAYAKRSLAYAKSNNYQSALADLTKLSELLPQALQDAQYLTKLGVFAYETGDKSKAIEYWQKAIKINNQEMEANLALGVALYAQGKQQGGLNKAEIAIKTNPDIVNLDLLKENGWGDQLLADTKKLLENPQIKATLSKN